MQNTLDQHVFLYELEIEFDSQLVTWSIRLNCMLNITKCDSPAIEPVVKCVISFKTIKVYFARVLCLFFFFLSFTHHMCMYDHEYGMPFGIRSTVVNMYIVHSTDSSNKQITSLRICIFIIAAIELLTTSLHWGSGRFSTGVINFSKWCLTYLLRTNLDLKKPIPYPLKRTKDSGDELVFFSKNFSAFFNKTKKTISVQFLFLLSVWKSAISLFMMKLWLQ